jgi:hypothetical protein
MTRGAGRRTGDERIREREPLGKQSVAFEASKADRRDVLIENRDNINKIHKPQPWERKGYWKKSQVDENLND